jgi:hypothetical protein
MNKDDVIRMAKEAGLLRVGDGWTEPHRCGATEVSKFAALAFAAGAEHEREECAKVCELIRPTAYSESDLCAEAIRARGEVTREEAQRLINYLEGCLVAGDPTDLIETIRFRLLELEQKKGKKA